MFDVGKKYTIGVITYTLDGHIDVDNDGGWEVAEVTMPMVKFTRYGQEWNLNVSCPFFAQAFLETP